MTHERLEYTGIVWT